MSSPGSIGPPNLPRDPATGSCWTLESRLPPLKYGERRLKYDSCFALPGEEAIDVGSVEFPCRIAEFLRMLMRHQYNK
jgi:hypothetical protein